MQYQLSVEGVQKIAEYLVTRPYNEVSHLIDILKSGKGISEDSDAAPVGDEPAAAADEPEASPACGIKQ